MGGRVPGGLFHGGRGIGLPCRLGFTVEGEGQLALGVLAVGLEPELPAAIFELAKEVGVGWKDAGDVLESSAGSVTPCSVPSS